MRALALLHRWIGISLFLLLTLWFASGAIMHFVPFPALSERQRLDRSTAIDLTRLRVAPPAALALAPAAIRMRLLGIQGRPVYVLEEQSGRVVTVAADSGMRLDVLTSTDARRIAAAFEGAQALDAAGPILLDQWTVPNELDVYRPLYRVRLGDAAGTTVYVSARTGEVVQRTTATERGWNWCGANIHWIYFAALRAHWHAWDRLVWSLALAALLTTIAGVWLGWLRFAAVRRSSRGRLTPFRGWLGWHHRIGLFAGPVVLVWIFSGWLSMDHGRLFPTGRPGALEMERLQGMALRAIASAAPLSTIRAAGPAAELLFGAIAGRAFIAARGAGPDRITWVDERSQPSVGIPPALLIAGARAAWPGEAVIDGGRVPIDSLYSIAEDMPARTRVFHVGTTLDVYLDQDSGRIVTVMDSRRRAYEWLYYALHTFTFPGLVRRPLLRDVVVLVPLGGGFIFILTAAIVAVARLRRTFAGRNARP